MRQRPELADATDCSTTYSTGLAKWTAKATPERERAAGAVPASTSLAFHTPMKLSSATAEAAMP